MADTLAFEQEPTHSGTSKTPIYGALILALVGIVLLLATAGSLLQVVAATLTLGLVAAALALCVKWQPEVITVREEIPVPVPEPVAEPVPETNLQEQPLAPDPMLISHLDDLRNNVEVILEEMGEAGKLAKA